MTHPEIDPAAEARRSLEAALYECKRVVVGQDAMLERLLVALLDRRSRAARGRARPGQDAHRADARHGARRHLPPHPVHARPRAGRPRRHAHLAARRRHVPDRARPGVRQPAARRRDQPRARQGAVRAARGHAGAPGHDRRRDATACPSRSSCSPRRTRSSPRGPTTCPRPRSTASCSSSSSTTPTSRTRSPSSTASLADAGPVPERMAIEDLLEHQRGRARGVRRPRRHRLRRRARRRHPPPGRYGLADLEPLIQFGASPRASLGLVQAARALALLRGRTYVAHHDVRDLAADVLRHRLVLSYDALADRVRAGRADRPHRRAVEPARPVAPGGGGVTLIDPPGRQGPGPLAHDAIAPARPRVARRAGGALPGERRAPGVGSGTELAQLRPYEPGDDPRRLDPAASARTGVPHVRQHVPERALTTWIVLDLSAVDGVRDRAAPEVRRRRGRRLDGRRSSPSAAAAASRSSRPARPRARRCRRARPPRVRRGAAAGRRRRRARRTAGRAGAARRARARRAASRARAAWSPSSRTSATTDGRRRCARSPSATR